MQATSSDVALPARRPLIRIRTLLLLGLVAWFGSYAYPRARAAWELHGAATALADYSLCMVGPTGAGLMRDEVQEFWRLVRRRLIGAEPFSRPFDECGELAQRVTGDAEIATAHSAEAASFVEYHGEGEATATQQTLADLGVSPTYVAALSEQAWPFVRGGYKRLIKPSPKAKEALHPVELPVPAVGHGLPSWYSHYRATLKTQRGYLLAIGRSANLSVYESTDDGVSWRGVSANRPEVADFAERCPIDLEGRSFTFVLGQDAQSTYVSSLGPDGAPYTTLVAEAGTHILAAACDADGLVAALMQEGSPRVRLKLCPFRRQCEALPPPPSASSGLKFPLDIARVEGTTVVAVATGGIVRVASTRDDGQSWTPYRVAYDQLEHPEASMGLPAPSRLLALEDHLVLYGGGKEAGEGYLVLQSEDQGASWHSPTHAVSAR